MYPPSRTLLAATVPTSLTALQELSGEHFTLKCVTRLHEAVTALNEGVDAVLCNIHFDDGALYDFLRIAKSHDVALDVPFFVIDASPTPVSPAITQSISIASKALGADQVVNMTQWIAEMGVRKAQLKVIHTVLNSLEVRVSSTAFIPG